jgi:hypothetical protein
MKAHTAPRLKTNRIPQRIIHQRAVVVRRGTEMGYGGVVLAGHSRPLHDLAVPLMKSQYLR